MERVDCLIIGAGVVGLAAARRVSSEGRSCVVVDRLEKFGQGISSRNSEVIHAGLYYPKNSLKSEFCVRGNRLLYDYCRTHHIPVSKCGKIVVATNAEECEKLSSLMQAGMMNGVNDLSLLSGHEVARLEPNVRAKSGLLSPSSGIIDSHSLMVSLVGEVLDASGVVVGNTDIKRITPKTPGFEVLMDIDGDDYALYAHSVINSAGLGAQGIAHKIEGFSKDLVPTLHMCKGTYFSLAGKSPFNRLIYPVPPSRVDGLGIHATIDLAGAVKFGPDIEYVGYEDYKVDSEKAVEFYHSIRRYFPAVAQEQLQVAYCGIRPKLQGPTDSFRDFCISDGMDAGNDFSGLVQLFGIESPGLTSSLAIADHVASLINKSF